MENIHPSVQQEYTSLEGGKPSRRGSVWLLQPGSRRRSKVILSIHYSNFDCFLVVSQDKLMCKDCGYINLKSAKIKQLPQSPETKLYSFQLMPRQCDSNTLTFGLTSESELQEWVSALEDAVNYCPAQKTLNLSPRRKDSEKQTLNSRAETTRKRRSSQLPALEEEGAEE